MVAIQPEAELQLKLISATKLDNYPVGKFVSEIHAIVEKLPLPADEVLSRLGEFNEVIDNTENKPPTKRRCLAACENQVNLSYSCLGVPKIV